MTNRPTQGWQPTGAGAAERSCKGAATHNGRASSDHASGPSLIVVAAIVVALMLAAAPARAQEAEAPGPEETPEATGMEAGYGPPEASDGSVETSDGDRSVRVGDGCVVVEEGGGEDLAVGSCDEADDAGDRGGGGDTAGESRPDEVRTSPQDTTERTLTEGTTQEETAPAGTTDFEESTASEGTAPEETGPAAGRGAGAECPTAPVGETFEATVERAVDGDTLELAEPVEGLSRVRLIGVDAPETEGEGGEPEPYAEEAAGFAASELEGERVLLELDEETTDPDGRLLAHVWREQEPSRLERWMPGDESKLFNLALLERGHATAMPVEPNARYAVCFDAAERVAREEGNGLWGAGGPDDEQYEEATDPESSDPELTTPEAEEPERTLSEETNAGGPSEEEAPTGFDSLPVTDDRPEQASPETTEPTGRTTPDLPEDNGEEKIEAPQDQYGEPEERTVPEVAPAGEPASEDRVPPTDGDTFGSDAETDPIREATVPEERTISEPSNETSEETTGTRYDQYGEPEERAVLEIAPDGAPVRESSIPAASEGESGYDAEAGPASAATPTVAPLPALPTRQTPEGPAPVLPATGGASFLPLILGAVVLTAGTLSLGLLRRGDRRRGVRSDER